MKKILLLSAIVFPIEIFAQTNNINPQVQIQNANYYNQADVSNDNNPIQTNIENQQANPPAQVQQQQSSGSVFASNENNTSHGKAYCKDCEAVKKALAAERASSNKHRHRNSLGLKRWSKKISARMNFKMKKMFAHRKKIKTSYEICFNWK